jgi:hypothetical protein
MGIIVLLLIWAFLGWKAGLLCTVLYVGYHAMRFMIDLWHMNRDIYGDSLITREWKHFLRTLRAK